MNRSAIERRIVKFEKQITLLESMSFKEWLRIWLKGLWLFIFWLAALACVFAFTHQTLQSFELAALISFGLAVLFLLFLRYTVAFGIVLSSLLLSILLAVIFDGTDLSLAEGWPDTKSGITTFESKLNLRLKAAIAKRNNAIATLKIKLANKTRH